MLLPRTRRRSSRSPAKDRPPPKGGEEGGRMSQRRHGRQPDPATVVPRAGPRSSARAAPSTPPTASSSRQEEGEMTRKRNYHNKSLEEKEPPQEKDEAVVLETEGEKKEEDAPQTRRRGRPSKQHLESPSKSSSTAEAVSNNRKRRRTRKDAGSDDPAAQSSSSPDAAAPPPGLLDPTEPSKRPLKKGRVEVFLIDKKPPEAVIPILADRAARPSLPGYRPPLDPLELRTPSEEDDDESPAITANGKHARADHGDHNNTDPARHIRAPGQMHGLAIPPPVPSNQCAGCGGTRNQELDTPDAAAHPVLLCDGPGCGREYHLACCVPALSELPDPDQTWLCWDCSPRGSTEQLEAYLDQCQDKRTAFFHRMLSSSSSSLEAEANLNSGALYQKYLTHLHRADRREHGFFTGRGKSADDGDGVEWPISELERAMLIEKVAAFDPDVGLRGQNQPTSTEELLDPEAGPPPEFWIGKPLRLYNPLADQYHVGRLVDMRPRLHPPAPPPRPPCHHHVEYLVRFPAGKDDRKESYYQWLGLEEYSCAVGIGLVAMASHNKLASHNKHHGPTQWEPGMLWARTTRELIPARELLNPHDDEIFFRSENESAAADSVTKGGTSSPPTRSAGKPKSKGGRGSRGGQRYQKARPRLKIMALARPFGSDNFHLVNVKSECAEWSTRMPALTSATDSRRCRLVWALAQVEWSEQRRVLDWQAMPLKYPYGPRSISSLDRYSLPELVLERTQVSSQEAASLVENQARLCPNFPRGLDRSKILQHLQNRGLEVSKDVGGGLDCVITTRMDLADFQKEYDWIQQVYCADHRSAPQPQNTEQNGQNRSDVIIHEVKGPPAAHRSAPPQPQNTEQNGQNRSDLIIHEVEAPPGVMGLRVDLVSEGLLVQELSDHSSVVGKVLVGDVIVAINDVDTRNMPDETMEALTLQQKTLKIIRKNSS